MTLTTQLQEKLEASHRLTYPRHKWPLQAAEALAASAVIICVAWLLKVNMALLMLLGLTAVSVISYVVWSDRLRVRRLSRLHQFGSESSPLLGWGKPAWTRIQVARWVGPKSTDSARIRLYYNPGFPMNALAVGQVTKVAASRLGDSWKLHKHRQQSNWIEITRTTPEKDSTPEVSDEVARAREVSEQIFGATATVETQSDKLGMSEVEIGFGLNARLSVPAVRSRIEKVVSQQLPNRWRAEWDLEHDKVTFRRRPEMPSSVPHPAPAPRTGTSLETYREFSVPYGVDEDGNAMRWTPRRNPHHIVTGTSGSGKTVCMIGMLLEFAHAGWQVYVNDAKLIEFLGVRDWPNVRLVSKNTEEQTRILHHAHEVMEQRYKMIVEGRATEDDFEPMVVFLDEFADYREELTDWYAEIKVKGDTPRPPVLRRVRSVARKGRTARVHYVLGLQRPDAEFLTGEVRDNFSARTSLGRLSPQGAMMMWENAYTGVSLPRTAIGRGVTLNEYGEPVEFQCYWTPDPRKVRPGTDDWDILAALDPGEPAYQRQKIEPPEAEFVDDETVIVTYTAIAESRISILDQVNAPTEFPYLREIPGRTATLTSEPTPPVEPERPAAPTNSNDHEEQDFEGYPDPKSVSVAEVEAGDLVLVDEQLDLWGVVEDVTPDEFSDDLLAIDYRDYESGEPGALTLDMSSVVTVRHPDLAQQQ